MENRKPLNSFVPRPYQEVIYDALENKGYKRIMAIWPRRAGKDCVAFNLIFRSALRKIGVYYYIFPTYSQAKKVIWDSITNQGKKFLDYIPEELIVATNSQEMKITLTNGSLIQLVGSDNIDSLVGTNPFGIVFSEYALQDPRAYQFMSPILAANDGFAIFISTPRGKNSLWELYQLALASPEWYCDKLTVDDTKHIPLSVIERERAEGVMSEDLIQQEYYTSFTMGVEGAYYAKYLDTLRHKGQITSVPWQPAFPVHTAWDLGMRDATSIIFFQNIGKSLHLIDYYENSKEGLEHYVSHLRSKPYIYGKHIAPHDIKVREWGSGITRIEKARQLGVKFTMSSEVSIEDGIEAVRSTLSRCYFDQANCAQLLKALENYRQEYDAKKKIYKNHPLHDYSSHGSDAMRYLAVSLPKTQDSLTSSDIEKNYQEARYGSDQSNLPNIFRTDLPKY